jgi:4a-hydroxytetrahydrobiopterin dehydratase
VNLLSDGAAPDPVDPDNPMPPSKLSPSTRDAWLSAHPEWSLADGKLHRVFLFRDFVEAFAWMGRIAVVAEAMLHHPEWLNVYRTVEVWLTTHDAAGVTTLDLELAEAMEQSLP